MVDGVPLPWRAAAALLLALILAYMIVPLAVVVGTSVSTSQFLVFPPTGFTLRWYGEVLASSKYVDAARTSLLLAVLATLLSLACGVPAAIALARRRLPGSNAMAALFLSPLILPAIVFGIGLLMFFSVYADGPSFFALVVGHAVITLPYVVRTVMAVFADADPATEEAARTMGARAWQRYWHVVLPQVRGGIAAGAFFAFNISFDDAVVALFLRAPGIDTLPLRIYNELEFSPDPAVAAVSSMIIAATVVLVFASTMMLGAAKVAEQHGDGRR